MLEIRQRMRRHRCKNSHYSDERDSKEAVVLMCLSSSHTLLMTLSLQLYVVKEVDCDSMRLDVLAWDVNLVY